MSTHAIHDAQDGAAISRRSALSGVLHNAGSPGSRCPTPDRRPPVPASPHGTPAAAYGPFADATSPDALPQHAATAATAAATTRSVSPAAERRPRQHNPYSLTATMPIGTGLAFRNPMPDLWLQCGYRKCEPLAVRVESPPPIDCDSAATPESQTEEVEEKALDSATPSNPSHDDGPQDDVLHPAPPPSAEDAADATSLSDDVAIPFTRSQAASTGAVTTPRDHAVTPHATSGPPRGSACVAKATVMPSARPSPANRELAPPVALVRFRYRSAYFCVAADLAEACDPGTLVVVDGDRGVDAGTVVEIVPTPPDGQRHPTAWVRRVANTEDTDLRRAMDREADRAVEFVRGLQSDRDVGGDFCGATLLDCEFQLDGRKLYVHFHHRHRVKFAKIPATIFHEFKCRVWMHQTNYYDT
eukprot:CAMPEP_0174826660 /NCGR_PEP_ID=MMETSP1114-20130205/71_1 /TAXON_ID=312471 /ORGANISM="Neobodo designis, Strain CCAP 1951/1" /LENGTH=414 /DNA_ID=CAMNT_0016060201 /DNA_START=164 /DNA_END=1408 /DNA_ORIENTATION=+